MKNQDLIRYHQADLPKMSGLSVVCIHMTIDRAAADGIDAKTVKAAIEAGFRAGKIELVPHSRTHKMTEKEEKSVIYIRSASMFYWKPKQGVK